MTWKRTFLLAALLLLVACAGPVAERVETTLEDATTAPTPARAAPAQLPATFSGAPLLLIGWDDALGRVVRAVDPLTGMDAPGYEPLSFDGQRDAMFISPHALAPDGQQLAIAGVQGTTCYGYAGGETCGPRSSTIYLVDVAAWSLRRAELSPGGWAGQMAYSPDGRQLVVAVRDAAIDDTLTLIDTLTGETLTRRALPFLPSLLRYTADGATLVVYGQPDGKERGMSPPPPPRVLLLDATTLATAWETALEAVVSGHWCLANCAADHGLRKMTSVVPGVVLSPDGRRLTIVHADEQRLTRVDLVQRTTQSDVITRTGAWLDRLLAATAGVARAKGPMDSYARTAVLSPDGQKLYVVGYDFTMTQDGAGGWHVEEALRPLQIIDPSSGRILAEIDAPAHTARLTPAGEYVLLIDLSAGAPVTTVFDTATMAPVAQLEDIDILTVVDLAGKLGIAGQSIRHRESHITVFEPVSLTPLAEWSADGPAWLVQQP